MFRVSRKLVGSHPGQKGGLGGSHKLTRVASAFLEVCGLMYRATRYKEMVDKHSTLLTYPRWTVHGYHFLSEKLGLRML